MKTKIQRWGNSLGVRIPKPFADELALEDGSPVEIVVEHGWLALRPVIRKRYELDELLAEIRPDNLHEPEPPFAKKKEGS